MAAGFIVIRRGMLRDGAGSEQVCSLYAMLDNPLLGSNKMYAVDVPRNGIAYRPHNFVERSKFTGDYKFEYGPHDLTVTKAPTVRDCKGATHPTRRSRTAASLRYPIGPSA
ncbi:hypothetical protein M422DRAFT_274253 [Sphaerobolus stellatus SS14]|uniref:Uncharacterized protein n=1 Tax=Sphaerobolus stellatus (strain SS14) TaxID=990650 RepID=A0A0C9UI42_SPHS4|nr:hypothetical protein M422DRAFT_274253 [Sphaerobolus stellatus SS14]